MIHLEHEPPKTPQPLKKITIDPGEIFNKFRIEPDANLLKITISDNRGDVAASSIGYAEIDELCEALQTFKKQRYGDF